MKKRRILFGLCAFSAVLGLAACKGDETEPDPIVQEEEFTITFNSNGGSAIASKKAKKDEKITNPGAPTREGYTFDGWFKDAACTLPWNFATDVVTGNATLYAKWTKKDIPAPVEKYSVTYMINGHGTQPDNLTDQTKLPDTLPVLSEEGWTFDGWYTDEALQNEAEAGAVLTANATLYAKWTKKDTPAPVEKYSVTYVINGHGEQPDNLTDQTKLPDTLPVLSEEGWTFDGWYTDEALQNEAEAGAALTANATLYAKWTKKDTPAPVEKYSVTYVINGHGEQPDNLTDQTNLPDELPVLTADGWGFEGWFTDEALQNEAEAGVALTANVTLYAKWKLLTEYEAFVAKGNILYASDFIVDSEEILNSNAVSEYDEALGKWMGTINNGDNFDEKNKLEIKDGRLHIIDDSAKTTYAYLNVNPVFYSVIEVKAVIQPTVQAGSWSIFTLMSPYSSSAYLLDLRTDSNKTICYRTQTVDPNTGWVDSALSIGGFTYVENKDITIDITANLSTGEIVLVLSQEGKSKTYNIAIDTESLESVGFPLAFSGIKMMTAGTASRSITVDWLGARVAAEDLEGAKAFALNMLEAQYAEFDEADYTQNLEQLQKAYNDGIAAINAAQNNTEAINAINEAMDAMYDVKTDDQLAAADLAAQAREQLAALKEQHKDNYTITKDSEDDYYANKEDFEQLFAYAQERLENPYSTEEVQNVLDYVNSMLGENGLRKDAAVLVDYRNAIQNQVWQYINENGPYNYHYQELNEVMESLESELASATTKADIASKKEAAIAAIDEIDNDATVVNNAKPAAKTEVEEHAAAAIAELDAENDVEYIALINETKDAALTAIDNATILDGNNGVNDIVITAKAEITRLAGLAGQTPEQMIQDGKDQFRYYVDQKKGQYAPDDAVLDELEAVYTDHVDEFDSLETVSVTTVTNKLNALKLLVDGVVANDDLRKAKQQQVQNLSDFAEGVKNQTMSEAVKADIDDLVEEWTETINNATSLDALNSITDQAYQAITDVINGMWEREFKVTYTNAVGSVMAQYDQPLDLSKIHVTGMVVTGAFYDNQEITEENPLRVYDDGVEITLVFGDGVDVEDHILWKAEMGASGSGVFIDNDLFSLSQDAGFEYLSATFSSGYDVAWKSANFKNDGTDVPIILTIKENLSSLTLHAGLADSGWSSNRKGVVSFVKDGVEIATVGNKDTNTKHFGVVTLEDLECGDVIVITARDLSNGSRIFLFDAEAQVDYDAVPEKLVSITWGDAEEATLYTHIEVVNAPEEDPVGTGDFQYWYYVNEEGHNVIFEAQKFPAGTEIQMLAKFASANLFINYHYVGVDIEKEVYSNEYYVENAGLTLTDDELTEHFTISGYIRAGFYNESACETTFDFENVTASETTINVYVKFDKKPSVDASVEIKDVDHTDGKALNFSVTNGAEENPIKYYDVTGSGGNFSRSGNAIQATGNGRTISITAGTNIESVTLTVTLSLGDGSGLASKNLDIAMTGAVSETKTFNKTTNSFTFTLKAGESVTFTPSGSARIAIYDVTASVILKD